MKTISLAGTWRLSSDVEARASAEYSKAEACSTRVELPGSLAVQGLGDPVTLETPWTGTIFNRVSFDSAAYAPYRATGNIKFPFWLQPETAYLGAACYERDFEIPEAWAGRRLVLTLERPHWLTQVWVDDVEQGTGDSLSTPHRFDLGNKLSAGTHHLRLRVDNRLRIAVGENAHSVSDHTQGNWNGLIGRIEVSAYESAWFEDLRLETQVATRTVSVRGRIGGAVECRVSLALGNAPALLASVGAEGHFSAECSLSPEAGLWDEHQPVLHSLEARLLLGNQEVDTRSLRFGLRELSTQGTEFRLNGRPLFLRGTLECCIFPLTGHPPMDLASWRRVMQAVKAHGLNHLRFHSWCPPEAAFIAGDELGVYFQVEVATWPNAVAVEAGSSPAGIGDGNTVDAWVYAETERILREYGNHPCFLMLAAGNEPGGPRHAEFLGAWVAHFRAQDSRRLFTGTAGWPELKENHFHVIPEPRGHQWLDGLRSRFNATEPSTTMDYRQSIARREVPLVSHEIGQWCSYPPLKDAAKYSGHLKARNYEIFAETLAANGLAGQLDDFVQASGKLQALCYKEEIEASLRTPGMGGFQLLDLRDFPGQGTAPVGVLNAFWESKGYITAEAFRRFCAPTVLLARLPKRVFISEESVCIKIEAAHFGPAKLEGAVLSWSLLREDSSVLRSGSFAPQHIGFGSGLPLGEIQVSFSSVDAPEHLRLFVTLDQTSIGNDWDLWLYPRKQPLETGEVIIAQEWNDEVRLALEKGGKVLLSLKARDLTKPAEIELGFTPVFWNTWCTKAQAPHTLGILCKPEHPAFAAFPTSSHTDWHWWYLLHRAFALRLDTLPHKLSPLVQVIDDWYTNRKLGLLIEAQVGPGRLIISGTDLSAPEDPVKHQFLESLLRYMNSEAFQPTVPLTRDEVQNLLRTS